MKAQPPNDSPRHGWLLTGLRALVALCLVTSALPARPEPPDQVVSNTPVSPPPRPIQLRCDYAEQPIAVDCPTPSLGWVLEPRGFNQRQTAYHIRVATTPEQLDRDAADLWDSGKVDSPESVQVPYAGRPLRSGDRCFWKVRIWDAAGQPSAWSDLARWEMALLSQRDWLADWIGAGPPSEPRGPAGFFKSTNEWNAPHPIPHDGRSVLLRKEFMLPKLIRRARVHVTGLGYYELFCNGQKVGPNVLAPAKSNYRQWVLYDTFDLAPHLRPGTNVLGISLGNGWFNPYPKWWQPYRMQWFGAKRARLQLHLEYTDGDAQVIGSDETWQTAPGPVLDACIYDGEVYDAREERPDWNRVGADGKGWRPATRMESPGGVMVSHHMPPIQVVEHLAPVARSHPKPGVWVFDFGQNFAGWARLRTTAPRGTRIQLRYAEDAHPDGSLDVTSNERALGTDTYIARGGEAETYEPRFTFHGFRYVEVTGLPEPPALSDLLGCVVHTACRATGSFTTDHDLINRIHRATVWSQRGNLMGYPMDCPQRDERLGWFGDAMVSMEQAMFNFDMPLFLGHWLEGIRRNQNPTNGDISIISPRPYLPEEPDPTWSSAFIVMTWDYYSHYGDRRFLAAQYDAMKRYVDYLGTQASHHILPKYWIGDWGTIVKGWQEGQPVSVNTGFYYLNATIVAKAAAALGKTADARRYRRLAANIGAAYQRAFLDPASRSYDDGTQFSNAFSLWLGLVRPPDQPIVLRHILNDLARHDGHFNVGVLGAKYLLDALTESHRPDVAFALATQTGYPSWAHMLEGGRTTLSEFWDLRGSHNHVMMGSVDGWFYRVLAGIRADESAPGFAHFYVQPFFPPALSHVRASVQTVRGEIAVTWERRNDAIHLAVRIPGNSRATITLPRTTPETILSHPPLRARPAGNQATFSAGSGDYQFRIPGAP